MSSQKRITEAEVKKAVQRACKKVLKEIENEPTLVIEADPDNTRADTEPLEDVQRWLFRRREEHDDDQPSDS